VRTRFRLPKKLGGLSFHATVTSGVGAYLGGVIAAASSLRRAVGDIDMGSFFAEASRVFDAAKAEIAQSSPKAHRVLCLIRRSSGARWTWLPA